MANETGNIPDNVTSEVPGNAEAKAISVGTMLRETRERLGLSVDDVVNRIKFAPRQIVALEADDFAQLPEIAFVRGFVRSYARLLQLDPAPLLAALPHAPAEAVLVAENTLTEVPFSNSYSARKHNIIWLAAALVVALALALFMLLHGNEPNVPNPPVPSQVNVEPLELPSMEVLPESTVLPVSPSGVSALPAQAPVAPEGLPAVREPAEAKGSVELPEPSLRAASSVASARGTPEGAPKVSNPLDAKASVDLSAPPLRVDPSAVKVVQKEPGVLPKSAGTLRMTFDDDSWVEVTDRDGKRLLSQINPRGSEQNLDGKPPFSLVIGRAAAVRLYYKGQQIDLVPHTKISTARLTLE